MNGDQLDEVIDRGLRDYLAQEPAFGMEVRVLRRVRRRGPRLRFGWAVAACGLLAIFAAGSWQRPVETLAITPISAWIEVPPPIFCLATRGRVMRRKPGITAGERALLRFVQDHPEQALEAFAKPDSPIAVEQIVIPPLAIEPLETQEENKK
jgi:ABC-type proline/glycine betaine transport system permease subunit